MNILKWFSDLIFPEGITCNFCGDEVFHNESHSLCEKCIKELPFMPNNVCKICGGDLVADEKVCLFCKNSKRYFDIARAPFVYKDGVANAIKSFKYKNRRYLAKTFAHFLAIEFYKNDFKPDLIIPIPLHEKRYKKRGYNQSELLAVELSKIIDVKVDTKAFQKIKHTEFQTNLNYEERQENLKESFAVVDKDVLKNKSILLIDDVFTTGATLKTASKCLKTNGKVKKIFCLTVAHRILEEVH